MEASQAAEAGTSSSLTERKEELIVSLEEKLADLGWAVRSKKRRNTLSHRMAGPLCAADCRHPSAPQRAFPSIPTENQFHIPL